MDPLGAVWFLIQYINWEEKHFFVHWSNKQMTYVTPGSAFIFYIFMEPDGSIYQETD